MKAQFLTLAVLSGLGLLVALTFGCRRQTAAQKPDSGIVQAMNRGVSLMGQYEYDAAVQAFEEALKAEPGLVEAQINLAIARFNRGRKENQDTEQARAILEAVLQKEPANLRAWYFKGIILQQVGQAESAVACFQKVVQARPDDGAAWYLLGMCKERAGQKAEQEMLKAVTLRPYLSSAYYRLYQNLQAEGQTDKAKPYLEKFKVLRESPLAETITLPQYNQMGELALALPLPARPVPPISKGVYTSQPARRLHESREPLLYGVRSAAPGPIDQAGSQLPFGGAAVGDLNGDGSLDMVLTSQGPDGAGRLVLLLGLSQGGLTNATAGSGLEQVRSAISCALGDFDNDGILDLFVAGEKGNALFRGRGNGTFVDVTRPAGIGGQPAGACSALFLDADHDGDLDIFVCGTPPLGNQLWNNNADGTFTNLAASAGVACPESATVMVLAGDLDGDRDMDLILLQKGRPARVFLNDLLARYREVDCGANIQGDLGGVLQDFNGDGHLDVLALGGQSPTLQLFVGDGHGKFRADAAFARCAAAAASGGPIRAFRVADLDLDGDLDVALFSTEAHALLNDGEGRFVFRPQFWKVPGGGELAGAEVLDFNGDCIPDLLRIERGPSGGVVLLPGVLTPPTTALSIAATGMRGRDKRTRSPATGYGVALAARAGLREQSQLYTGQAGGFNQSPVPVVFGLGGARQADYVRFLWPDGVAQVETALAAGQQHKVAELERKISSCPVLFAWNGRRFEFVTDFAGVGGLGYFVAPGESAPPQVLEHIKIEPAQLVPKEGVYELRIAEPMEETAYLDRLELLAVDHAAEASVFPDERLAIGGPAPTHELLVVENRLFPKRATDPDGRDCTDKIARVDRIYAYEPPLDRRFFGFCRPHTLELDFDDQLAGVSTNQRVHLFIDGSIEYPFSQTVYAASQARVGWQPIRIERRRQDGRWQTIVPDAGAPGGMARTMTVDLTGLVNGPDCRLRLTSNLEISYDQAFLGLTHGADKVKVHALPVAEAELRRGGFAREYSPDGRLPLIYDYEQREASAPFHVLKGAYTRYGPVTDLLRAFDDHYVLVGPGDEVAVKFDGSKLPPLAKGKTRSFILVSHAYCKDMDLYTASPQTLEPLPFRGMSRYPYPAPEHYPDSAEHRRFLEQYNTRIIE